MKNVDNKVAVSPSRPLIGSTAANLEGFVFKPNVLAWNRFDELTGKESEKKEAMFFQEWHCFVGLTFRCLYRNPVGCLILESFDCIEPIDVKR